jgi:hypothetical protein
MQRGISIPPMSAWAQARHVGALSTLAKCPLCLPYRRIDASQRNAALCHKRTHARGKEAPLFDDLVGGGKQCLRHVEAEYPSGLSVYDEFEPA